MRAWGETQAYYVLARAINNGIMRANSYNLHPHSKGEQATKQRLFSGTVYINMNGHAQLAS
jgi:hypothetical protein